MVPFRVKTLCTSKLVTILMMSSAFKKPLFALSTMCDFISPAMFSSLRIVGRFQFSSWRERSPHFKNQMAHWYMCHAWFTSCPCVFTMTSDALIQENFISSSAYRISNPIITVTWDWTIASRLLCFAFFVSCALASQSLEWSPRCWYVELGATWDALWCARMALCQRTSRHLLAVHASSSSFIHVLSSLIPLPSSSPLLSSISMWACCVRQTWTQLPLSLSLQLFSNSMQVCCMRWLSWG